MFLYAYKNEFIEKPVRYGTAFDKPSAKTIRKTRVAKGPRMFEPDEIRTLLKHSTINFRAMVLLGINAAMGNTDIGLLPISAVNLDEGWLDYPRAKTAIGRRIPLWSETIKALREALEARPEPNDPKAKTLFFIGPRGENYVGNHKGYRVTAEMNRAAARAGIEGRTFYDLRRSFQTVGQNAHDLIAVQSVMGHAPASGDMSAVYRQRVDDARLKAVVNTVRAWLFDETTGDDSDTDEPPETIPFRLIG
jgi:integrase